MQQIFSSPANGAASPDGDGLSSDNPSGDSGQQAESVVLPAIMTIETVEALAAEFKQLPLAEKSCLMLDASQVETITTPGLQLLVSLAKTLEAQAGTLIITGQKAPFTHALKDSGLLSLLGRPTENRAS